MTDFHFSPRPNRAHEINWYDWKDEAFAKAKNEKRPILLAISGVWCHWCHVMDETSYSNEGIINFINSNFVAIRVDTDQRPDINERYNMGGWPTTAILTSEGDLLTGATYIPPRQMLSFLQEMAELYQDRREELHLEIAGKKEQKPKDSFSPTSSLKPDVIEEIVEDVIESYDHEFGGFGTEPKFPMTEALSLCLYEYFDHDKEFMLEIALKTVRAMAEGGMYDPVEGGFFRYSTTRDWTVPHFEKMLEDNAQLLGVLVDAYNLTGKIDLAETARDVLRFLENSLYLPEKKAWAGTQDADEEYYKLPLQERNKKEAPYIDKTIYVNWNAILGRSLLKAGFVLEEQRWIDAGMETLNFLQKQCYDNDMGMAHFFKQKPELWGFLADQVETGFACNFAYQVTGEEKWLAQSEKLAAFCHDNLKNENGAFMDRVPEEGAKGALARPHYSVQQNARTARWLLELSALTYNQEYKDQAVKALLSFGQEYKRYGTLAAGFALAVADALRNWAVITISGPAANEQTQALHKVALQGFRPRRVIKFDREAEQSRAYPCFGEKCLPPVKDSLELEKIINEELLSGYHTYSPS